MIKIFESLRIRNQLQSLALRNRHTFEDEIKLNVSNAALEIKTCIGGENNGVVHIRAIRDESLWDEINTHYKILSNDYEKDVSRIPKNFK